MHGILQWGEVSSCLVFLRPAHFELNLLDPAGNINSSDSEGNVVTEGLC